MKNLIRSLLTMALLALTLAFAAPASASVLVLNCSGVFDGATTLNGTPLGGSTPFSFQALFDPTANLNDPPAAGVGVYPADVTFTLGAAAPYGVASMFVVFDTSAVSLYVFGLLDSATGSYLVSAFDAATPSFSGDNPTVTVLSQENVSLGIGYLTFTSNGIDQVLADFAFTNAGNATATITDSSAVPEPTTYLLLCLSLGVVGVVRRKLRITN